jgi:uncharacterized membrane protein YccC
LHRIYNAVLHRANRHILSFDFFKAAVVCFILAGALVWGYTNQNYKILFPFVSGVLFAYFPNIEGSQRHRITGIVLGFVWSFIMLATQLTLFATPPWLHFLVMMIFVFITSMVAVYGLRGSNVSFGGLYAIVSSYGIHAMGLPHQDALVMVLLGGGVYISLSTITQFFYQVHHIQTMLAECVDLTADYLRKLDQQVWDNKDVESELLRIESKLNSYHEILRSTLLNRQGKLFSSNKNRRQYLIFIELIDLYETTLAASHDMEQARDHFDGTEPFAKPYREFTTLLIKELDGFGESLRLNRKYQLDESLQTSLLNAEESFNALHENADMYVVLQNLIELKKKQLNTLNLIHKHYHNIISTETIGVNNRDSRFITIQDYSYKILLSNLNFESSIFRHSIRLCVAIAICFLLQDLISDENTGWIIVTTIVVLRPNYGLTRNRAYDRIAGTILGGLATLVVMYITTYQPALFALSGVCLLLGFSYVASRYLLGSFYITLCVMLLYVAFTGKSFDIVVDRVFYTFIGSMIALFVTYFVFPVWERESIFTAIRRAINANRRYLSGVNEIYETKNLINNEFKLLRKEAFVKNGNLYEAFQRLKEDPKSKRNQLSNSYAVVLLSHSTLKAIAAYSTYIQNHQTTEMSEDFKQVMVYILDQLRVAANISEGMLDSKPLVDNPTEALTRLDKYYYNLSQLRTEEIEFGVAKMSFEMSQRLQEGKVIIDHIKAIKSLAENTLQICKLLRSLPS